MTRRDFLKTSANTLPAIVAAPHLLTGTSASFNAAWYSHNRRFAELPQARVAYVEAGHGPAALFLHGYPLNSYQWRGAIERLHHHCRCIAPDLMSLGFTEPREDQVISPHTQVEMLAALLDHLHIESVDLVANDSGGLTAQLFLATHPHRVRSLLITNCDVDTNNPPTGFLPLADLARKGVLVDHFFVPQLNDKNLARSPKGLGGLAFTYPDRLTDETLEIYLRPFAQSPLRKKQLDQFTLALAVNDLVAIRENLRQWKGPVRIVWGLKDSLFGVEWAEWLDRTFPNSQGIRRIPEANLFFPEEMPDLIAEEALGLWTKNPRR
ncbi:alpha/beta fold hydrolase [Edaphobacter albus]|uniref:alpha/beta fold hydrolase n=1 Tax=Edaphobacter sp. 4G125 TaxID=2763071 RepID=UPI0016461A78|nr:alpha/beta hydrolase [Edaphobacter sp. 4G125]QNI36139.1 alpha/beta hydrolase [Edaphobacter sp. 4G125]